MTGSATATVRRVLPASAEVVYDEWLDAEAVAEFITPPPGRSGHIRWEPRVGGHFVIEMVDLDGVVQIDGEYLTLDRPRRLEFTWHSSIGGGFDSLVTIELEPHGPDATLMTIEHTRVPAAWRESHKDGWTAIAGQLEGRLNRS